jgi:hypothetical protein
VFCEMICALQATIDIVLEDTEITSHFIDVQRIFRRTANGLWRFNVRTRISALRRSVHLFCTLRKATVSFKGRCRNARPGLLTGVRECLRQYDSRVSTGLNLLHEVAVDEEYFRPLEAILSPGAKSLSCCDGLTAGSCADCNSIFRLPPAILSLCLLLAQAVLGGYRGTTRLTAAATCANCSSGDVSSSFPLSSVDAWVVRITSGSATGTLPSRPAISAKLLPPSCLDPSAAFLAALAGPLRHVVEHGYATTAITATRKYVVAIENANDNARFGVSRLDCLPLAAHPKIVGTAEPIPDPDTTIRL